MGSFKLRFRGRCKINIQANVFEYEVFADKELVRLVAESNDFEAYSKLFNIYAPKLRALYIEKIPDKPDLIEDLIQEVLAQVWAKASMYNPEFGEVSKWIFTLARDVQIEHGQEASVLSEDFTKTLQALSTAPDENSNPSQLIEQQELELSIEEKLLLLPKEQADVVQKIFHEGKSHALAAAELNIPIGTIKSRLRLAFSKLGLMLKGDVKQGGL